VFPVELPPLRQRTEDVPLLAEHFLTLAARRLGRTKPRLTLANVQLLQRYHWPGNVRELQHVIDRAVITSTGTRLNFGLPFVTGAVKVREESAAAPGVIWTDAQMRQLEADNIRAALKAASGKVSGPGGAAQLIGLKPTTLASRIKALGILVSKPGAKD